MKKFLAACLILFIAFAGLPQLSLAASQPLVWISATGEKTTDALTWYQQNKNHYYLFLPANFDVTSARFGFSGVKTLAIAPSASADMQEIAQGDSAAFLTEGEYAFAIDGKSRTLHVMRGSEGIPALYITTESGKLDYIHRDKENREAGTLIFVGPDGEVQYDGALDHIKCRGNSSMNFPKKNYQIKLQSGVDLMGMGKSKTWILTSSYRDKSLLRNQIMYDTAMYLGMPYTPEHISAEVYINNEYQGLYLFSERVMIDGDRIDIENLENATEKMNDQPLEEYTRIGPGTVTKGKYKAYDIPNEPEDITGGYLVEFESYPTRYKQEPSAYATKRNNILVVKSPEYASVSQMDYVSTRLQVFENAIFAKDGVDAATGLHYTDIMDMDSLVRKYLLEEFSKNYDGNSSSMYFYKPADSESTLFYAGPVWDYDSSFGSYAQPRNAKNVLSGKGMWIASDSTYKLWWPALYKQSDFYQQVVLCWQEEMKPAAEILLGLREAPDGCVLRSLDAYADTIRASSDMNLIRWPRLANPSSQAKTGTTLDENIAYLRTFMTDRYNYLNEQWR